MKNNLIQTRRKLYLTSIVLSLTICVYAQNAFYGNNRATLSRQSFNRLPVGSITVGGWLKKVLELQRDGRTGHLGEISIWLSKNDNSWLNKEGKGKYGWEELPYWLKGYANIAYMLKDKKNNQRS